MYKRRNKKMYILMGVVIFLTVVAVALLYVSGRGKVTEPVFLFRSLICRVIQRMRLCLTLFRTQWWN